MHIPDYEEILLVNNGVTQASISFTNALRWDEKGIRAALTWNHFDHNFLTKPYNQLVNYNSLIFSETQEKVNYSDDYQKINCLPSKEKINTMFELNGCTISKEEWVSFGKHSSLTNTYELIQTYAITDKKVTKDDLNYYIGLNSSFPVGFMKASYGTFLTVLNTIKMYDDFMENVSNLYNVSAFRDDFVVSMCGVEYEGTAYVHCPNPTMNYNLTGTWENIYICRYITSLLLSGFESAALNFVGIPSTSSVNLIFNNIINQNNFTVTSFENYIIIAIDGNPEHQLKLNASNGVMYDLSNLNNFLCKGAISNSTNNYCFHDSLTNNLIFNITKYNGRNQSEEFYMSDRDIRFLEDILAEFALGSAVALIPVIIASAGITSFLLPPLGLTIGLIILGIVLKSHLRDWDWKAGIGDSLVSLIHSKVLS